MTYVNVEEMILVRDDARRTFYPVTERAFPIHLCDGVWYPSRVSIHCESPRGANVLKLMFLVCR